MVATWLGVRDEGDVILVRSPQTTTLTLLLHGSDQRFIVKTNKIFLDKTMIDC